MKIKKEVWMRKTKKFRNFFSFPALIEPALARFTLLVVGAGQTNANAVSAFVLLSSCLPSHYLRTEVWTIRLFVRAAPLKLLNGKFEVNSFRFFECIKSL